MLIALDVEVSGAAAEGHEVQRGQIAGRVVEGHVLRAGIGAVDAGGGGAGGPLVDGGVVLHAGIGAGPGGGSGRAWGKDRVCEDVWTAGGDEELKTKNIVKA